LRQQSLQGFVLKKENFGEADKIVAIFTSQSGKIRTVAKGLRRIKSRRAPHLELFNLVDFVVHKSGSLPILTEAKKSPGNPQTQTDLEKIGLLFYCAEIVDRLMPENEPNWQVFEQLKLLVQDLNKVDLKDPKERVKIFVIKLLWILGFLPEGKYPDQAVSSFVEEIAERRIKSKGFLDKIQ